MFSKNVKTPADKSEDTAPDLADYVLTYTAEYNSRLLIYDAGDTRLTWVSFWKALALLQCGTTLVFAVPPLWKNENQPDPNLRKAQAILGKSLRFPLARHEALSCSFVNGLYSTLFTMFYDIDGSTGVAFRTLE